MKTTIIFFILLILCIQPISALAISELKQILKDENKLNSFKDTANNILDKSEQLRDIVGNNRIYYVRIGSKDLTVILKNGKVTQINTQRPSNPTHIAAATYDTVLLIANSKNQAFEVSKAWMSGKIIIMEAKECNQDTACEDNQVCHNGKCKDAYTIAVVPIAYQSSDSNLFYQHAKPEIDLLKRYAPVKHIRVHYIDPSVCPNYQCNDVCTDCQNKVKDCVQKAGLIGVADKAAGVSKEDVKTYIGRGQELLLCGCAGGIPAFTSLSRSRLYQGGLVYCYFTVAHEMGHQFGLYHVNAVGNEGGACRGPNKADCNAGNKKSDIMGYAFPQNHFGPAALAYLENTVFKNYQG